MRTPLEGIFNAFLDPSAQWAQEMWAAGDVIFASIFVMQLAWFGATLWMSSAGERGFAIDRFVGGLIKLVMVYGIVQSWYTLGGMVGEMALGIGRQVAGFDHLDGVVLAGQGTGLALFLLNPKVSWPLFVAGPLGVIPIVGALLTVTCYVIIALQVIFTTVYSYYVFASSGLLMAFWGSRLTAGIANGTLKELVYCFVRVISVYTIVGAAMNQADVLHRSLEDFSGFNPLVLVELHLEYWFAVVVMAFLVWWVPSRFAEKVVSSWSPRIGES